MNEEMTNRARARVLMERARALLAQQESASARDMADAIAGLLDEVERLKERDKKLWTLTGKLRGCGDPVIDAALNQKDEAFDVFIASLPETHWSKYDPSAVRIGWHHGRAALVRELAQAEPVAWVATIFEGWDVLLWSDKVDGSIPLIRRPEMP